MSSHAQVDIFSSLLTHSCRICKGECEAEEYNLCGTAANRPTISANLPVEAVRNLIAKTVHGLALFALQECMRIALILIKSSASSARTT